MNDKDIIKKLWAVPVLRKQIPSLIESNKKKYFALRDATEKQYQKWREMDREYERLYNGLDREV